MSINVPLRCGIGRHMIEGTPKYLTNERHINFVKKIRPEFRPEYEVCKGCLEVTERKYKQKYESALRKKKLKLKGNPSDGLISDPSISSRSASSNQTRTLRGDSMDRLVFQTPRNPLLKSVVFEDRTPLAQLQRRAASQTAVTNISNDTVSERSNDSSKVISTTSSSSSSAASVLRVVSQSQSQRDLVQQPQQPSQQSGSSSGIAQQLQQLLQQSESSLDTQPTTSAEAARKRLAKKRVHLTADPPTDDDDLYSDEPSPAVLSGARLPHIQPIPKRQQFVHANKDVMDIYLAGTTGG